VAWKIVGDVSEELASLFTVQAAQEQYLFPDKGSS
jgi:hypothetical protein